MSRFCDETRTKRGPSDSHRKETPECFSGHDFPAATEHADRMISMFPERVLFEDLLLRKRNLFFKEDEP